MPDIAIVAETVQQACALGIQLGVSGVAYAAKDMDLMRGHDLRAVIVAADLFDDITAGQRGMGSKSL